MSRLYELALFEEANHVGLPRAVALAALDEFNLHSLKINAILDAVDAATSLADLKTRIALIADFPPRTNAQLLAAVNSKLP